MIPLVKKITFISKLCQEDQRINKRGRSDIIFPIELNLHLKIIQYKTIKYNMIYIC